MKALQVGEFKSKFSEILKDIRNGKDIAITYGKKKEKVAVLISVDKYNTIVIDTKDIVQSKVLSRALNVVDKLSGDSYAAVCTLLKVKSVNKSQLLWPSISNR